MKVNIRHEKKEDHFEVEMLTREAFWNLYFPGCNEHFHVHQIRNHKDYIKDLSYVLELDGQIIGSIFYTKSKIMTKNKAIDTISFGPVSIDPKYHRRGYGRKLIEYSIEKAKSMGYRAIIILGYPYHYHPFGFKGGKTYNISMPDGLFYTGFMVLPLYENALDNIEGYAIFSDVFQEPDEETLDCFDKKFPPKEKAYQVSQDEFKKASAELEV